MSDARDDEIQKDRRQRHTQLLAGAIRLEHRAHQLILEAHEMRKLADRTCEIIEQVESGVKP